MVFAGYLQHGRSVDVEPVRRDFDAPVLEAEVGERFTAFEVGQIGGRDTVDIEDIEHGALGQSLVAELCGGPWDVHSALQQGEGRNAVRSECNDFPVEGGFSVIEHSAECVENLGERVADIVSVSRPQRRSLGTCYGYNSLAIPLAFEGPALPRGRIAECGEHRRHWLSHCGTHLSTVRGFVLVSAGFRR